MKPSSDAAVDCQKVGNGTTEKRAGRAERVRRLTFFIVTSAIKRIGAARFEMTVDGVYGDNYQHQGYRQQ